MKISVIIPTRSRAIYLRAAVQSALHAADLAGCAVEVVVSDNSSDDDTPQVVKAFQDARIIYRRTPTRLSMRQNFEFALGHSTGSHVLFIGDDDAVMPHGLRLLRDLIADTDADVFKWRVINYMWPNPDAATPGLLKLRPQLFTGRRSDIDPSVQLGRFLKGQFRSYHEGGMVYHGCVSRRLIDRALGRSGGPFFWCSSPDVFTSMQSMMATDMPLIKIDAPITLGGASPRSNGASGQNQAKTTSAKDGAEFAKFVAESEGDPFQGRLPAKCASIALVTLDCLQTAMQKQGLTRQIDRAGWIARINADIRPMHPEVQAECAGYTRLLLGADAALSLTYPALAHPAPEPTTSTAIHVKYRLGRVDISGGSPMEDVFAAALCLDALVALDRQPAKGAGALPGLAVALAIYRRAGRLG